MSSQCHFQRAQVKVSLLASTWQCDPTLMEAQAAGLMEGCAGLPAPLTGLHAAASTLPNSQEAFAAHLLLMSPL